MSLHISQLAAALNAWAPPRLAESYDNVGLHVGSFETEITSVLVALEITPEILEEAVAVGANLVVTHHPLWFRSRKHLRGDDFVSRCLLQAIRSDVALFALHTNLDNVFSGVNVRIAEKLGLEETRILQALDPAGETGAGRIGVLPTAMKPADFLKHVRTALDTRVLRFAPTEKAEIRTVALCGGAGSFLIYAAMGAGADALVTADVGYHYFFEPQGQLLLVDAGHFETEQYTVELICEKLRREFPKFASQNRIVQTKLSTNPVRYDF